ncbi:MAG TPA: SIS domain-containing protein [Solirubrobacteraceae bacterium]|nr:SIS domain-containing protein [Solirubrobacteraceae bacterium]
MLNFDEAKFLENQRGAVACAEELHGVIGDLVEGGSDNLLFVASGGAGILMWPAAALLAARSSLPSRVEHAAELVAAGSGLLSRRSIVVMPSRSGDTPETVEALHYCRGAGATVVTLTGTPDSPLAAQADHNFTNQVADDNSSESYYIQSIFIALSVMSARGEIDNYDELLTAARRLPEALLKAKEGFEPRAGEVAARIAEAPFHMILGAGGGWAEAMYYGMCILEEMQWILTRPVNAADFFHGPLELLEPGFNCLLLKDEGDLRPLMERVEAFVQGHTDRATTIDTATMEGLELPHALRALMAPALLATVLERVSTNLEALRDHPLTTRRYYRAMSY